MRSAIRAMSSHTKMTIFWLLFGASILLAVFPPLYLAGSGIDTPILGVPFSVAYWIFDALLATGAVWLLWIFENIRGEVGEEPEEVAA
ncbi:hypothetical protein RB608_07155 [Nocardioides sp. LHD-245]|uniref:hypothetical protein n=1 Tax=Nocardioides sp. LHD-245 TaxID=3051387 RepID=UPI0027E071A0|nr:hypothetical protein [Nocardioides sp. LHD-245]